MVMTSNHTDGIIISNLIPRLYKLPLSGSISTPDSSSNNLDIILALNRTIYTSTVDSERGITSVETILPYWYIANRNLTQVYVDDDDTVNHINPQLVVVSAELPSFFSASLAASGIIGLCLYFKYIFKNNIVLIIYL